MQNGKSLEEIEFEKLQQRFQRLTSVEGTDYHGEQDYPNREERLLTELKKLPNVPKHPIFNKEIELNPKLDEKDKLDLELEEMQEGQQKSQISEITEEPLIKSKDQGLRLRKSTFQQVKDKNLRNTCKQGNLEEVQRQLEQRANPYAQDENGKSAIDYANDANNTRLLRVLEGNNKDSTTDEQYIAQVSKPKKQWPLPAYLAIGETITTTLGAAGLMFYTGSWAFPPLGLALTVIGGCLALGLIGALIYENKAAIGNKIASVFQNHKTGNELLLPEPHAKTN